MQSDMHYYGTYAMARAAGLKPEACKIIATSAQYVDDNAGKNTIAFEDGAAIYLDATAHHATDAKNLDVEDQRDVWVPFHFFPGNQGDTYTERLVCQIDSPLAREMVEHNLSLADKPFSLELIGITAHVYADTFSHYGFSGVSSRHNMVSFSSIKLEGLTEESEAYFKKKAQSFMQKYGIEGKDMPNIKVPNFKKLWAKKKEQYSSFIAERASGGLGHGAVLTYPDMPYLKWSFQYQGVKKWTFENALTTPEKQKSARVEHNNPKTFIKGCEALHSMFQRYGKAAPQHVENHGRAFAEIKDSVDEIFNFQGGKKDRADKWQQAAKAGLLFTNDEGIPQYDENDWHTERDKLAELESSNEAIEKPIYRFFQAAAHHRTYVLRDLLPAHGLIVN